MTVVLDFLLVSHSPQSKTVIETIVYTILYRSPISDVYFQVRLRGVTPCPELTVSDT